MTLCQRLTGVLSVQRQPGCWRLVPWTLPSTSPFCVQETPNLPVFNHLFQMTIRPHLKMSAFLSRRGRGGERLKRISDTLGEASISMFGKILPLSFFPLHLVTRPRLLNRCSRVLPRQGNSTLKQQGAIQRNGAASSGATLYSGNGGARLPDLPFEGDPA